MTFEIIYIHHSSFALKTGHACLLFDYPGPDHRPSGAQEAAVEAARGMDLVLVHSHGHDDHFDPDPSPVLEAARSVRRVLSWDIAELQPEAVPEQDCLVAAPDERYTWRGMAVQALESNDMGCALLLDIHGLRVFHSGDLALWDWDRASPAEAQFTAGFFREAVARVRDMQPHVLFAVADPRLASRAGAEEFAREVAPPVFVPMHAFGNTDILPELASRVTAPGVDVFVYRQPGDAATFSVPLEEVHEPTP